MAAAVVTVSAVAVPPASADSVLVVPRSADGEKYGAQGLDASGASGRWTFTITAMSGKPAQLVIRIVTGAPGQQTFRFAATSHPRVGQTFTTWGEVPSGVHELSARISGGPVRPDDAVTVSVTTGS